MAIPATNISLIDRIFLHISFIYARCGSFAHDVRAVAASSHFDHDASVFCLWFLQPCYQNDPDMRSYYTEVCAWYTKNSRSNATKVMAKSSAWQLYEYREIWSKMLGDTHRYPVFVIWYIHIEHSSEQVEGIASKSWLWRTCMRPNETLYGNCRDCQNLYVRTRNPSADNYWTHVWTVTRKSLHGSEWSGKQMDKWQQRTNR